MTVIQSTYFDARGPDCTEETLRLALARAEALGVRDILVATTRGETGARAAELFQGYNLVVVTHSTGFARPDFQELTDEHRAAIEARGACILTAQHAFGGVGRAVRKKLDTYQVDEIMAYTLRTLGQGVKVAVEIALMAADAGLVRTDREAIAIGGTGRGADTALVLTPANAQTFFDLRIHEIICKPRLTREGGDE
ncbi:MAG: hypothetical protein KKA73_26660 [Chloroflexi bacterium]|nr:hypothetical protein [Chloroflexota bacterium]MBU1751283.1 hypothetical protein [Chloroflexota bacterium]MBU1879472.1 hypothetical protein [Chloroflexota bacterium]